MPVMWRNVMRFATGAVALFVFTMSSSVNADPPGGGQMPVFFMNWDATGDTVGNDAYDPNLFSDYMPTPGAAPIHTPGVATSFGTWVLGGPAGERERTGWRYRGGFVGLDQTYELSWDCVINPDPFVDATINITNITNSVQTYELYVPLAILPNGPMSEMTGSVSAVVLANNDTTATLAQAGSDPIYRAYIDGGVGLTPVGSPVAQLWDPYSLSAPAFDVNNDSTSFGPSLGPAANSDIGVYLKFTLTPGDSASVTGIFDIQPIPGPAGLAIFAAAGVLAGRRRRRD